MEKLEVKAKTHYEVECIGPKEELRAQYIKLKGRIAILEKFYLGWIARLLGYYASVKSMLELKWIEEFDNIVVTAGLNKLLDATFKTGLTTPAWYVGLKDTGTPVAADTMASHASWAAISPFSNTTLPALTLGTIASGSVSNSASKASFNIDATDDIYGAFLTDSDTVGGVTGTLYGVGDFSSVKSVTSGDTLNVTMTLTVSAP